MAFATASEPRPIAGDDKLRLIVEQMPFVVWTVDPQLQFTSSYGSTPDTLGMKQAEVVGVNLWEYFRTSDPAFQPIDAHIRALRGETVRYENEWLGSRFLVSVRPLRDAKGVITGALGAALDITERAQLEEQVRHGQKMEALGVLAGGIAHDFNNVLTGIIGYSHLLKNELEAEGRQSEAVTAILASAERAAQLTSQLLGFARRGRRQDAPVRIESILDEVALMLDRTIDKKIAIARKYAAPDAHVLGDATEMHQVFLNLALNAKDAMPDGGDLEFATEVSGGMLIVTVRDTGFGIPADVQNHMWEPFYTTKATGKGTGMGLAVVYGIVRAHNGAIRVDSAPGRGTTLEVTLPLSHLRRQAPAEAKAPSNGRGRVMIVDDEDVVRNVVGRMLQELGYSVAMMHGGREAVEYYTQHASTIDLVLLDMMMPGMNGRECFAALRNINPDVRVVLSTGYVQEGADQLIIREGLAGFLEKPYRISDLATAVGKALALSPKVA